MRRYGKTRTKLAFMIETMLREKENMPLVSVEPEDLWMQQGDYRKKTWDLAAWGVDVRSSGRFLKLYSWDTMGDCVRYGITICRPMKGDHFEREISCLKP